MSDAVFAPGAFLDATAVDPTEAGVVADLAEAATEPTPLPLSERVLSVVVPRGGSLHLLDTEKYLDQPLRKRGRARLFTAGSLVRYVNVHKGAGTSIYGDERTRAVAAIIDGHGSAHAGWGDHTAVLELRLTDPWQRWIKRNGQISSQQSFAEHIEDSLLDIQDPPGAELLELAQTFHATMSVNFKQSNVLSSGERQLVYEETIQAKAGQTGQLTVPKQFTIGLAPFEGSALYRLTARLRHRIVDGHLQIGYVLDNPEDVVRGAFDDVLDEIEQGTDLPVYRGSFPG